MDEGQARDAAALIARNRLDGLKLAAAPTFDALRNEADGYRVQSLVDTLLSPAYGPLAGHKIGCTTAVMQRYLNIDRACAGRVFAKQVHHGQVELARKMFVRPGVECEIAVELAHDLPARETPYTRDDVADAVGGAMAAIEIVDDRYQDFRSLGAPVLIADEFFNAGSVLAAPVKAWRRQDLAAIAGRMTINGREVGRGTGAQIMGHPLEALAWLANLRARQGQPLRRGAFVSLGSMVETKWVDAGDEIAVEVDHLGRVTAKFVAVPSR